MGSYYTRFKSAVSFSPIIRETDIVFEFRNIAYNSWIPTSLLALCACLIGAIVMWLAAEKAWFVSGVLWVFAALLFSKAKYERYKFDKEDGTVKVVTRGFTGFKEKVYNLSEIQDVDLQITPDIQGGDDIQLYLQFTNGVRIKLMAGHFCGIRGKIKKMIKKKLVEFLDLSQIPNTNRNDRKGHVRLGFDEDLENNHNPTAPLLEVSD